MNYLGTILALVGAIWMTVNAFKKDGVLAGILCFICGFYTIYYGIKNFAENKIPFILFLAGIALSIAFRPDFSGTAAGI